MPLGFLGTGGGAANCTDGFGGSALGTFERPKINTLFGSAIGAWITGVAFLIKIPMRNS
jgi:hypothetical protein